MELIADSAPCVCAAACGSEKRACVGECRCGCECGVGEGEVMAKINKARLPPTLRLFFFFYSLLSPRAVYLVFGHLLYIFFIIYFCCVSVFTNCVR